MLFTKVFGKDGSYQTPQGPINLNRGLKQAVVRSFHDAVNNGLKVPVTWGHLQQFAHSEDDAIYWQNKGVAGWVKDLQILPEDGNPFRALIEIPLDDDAKQIGTTVQEVSGVFNDVFQDGLGNQYKPFMSQLALCVYPVEPGQPNFELALPQHEKPLGSYQVAMSLSWSGAPEPYRQKKPASLVNVDANMGEQYSMAEGSRRDRYDERGKKRREASERKERRTSERYGDSATRGEAEDAMEGYRQQYGAAPRSYSREGTRAGKDTNKYRSYRRDQHHERQQSGAKTRLAFGDVYDPEELEDSVGENTNDSGVGDAPESADGFNQYGAKDDGRRHWEEFVDEDGESLGEAQPGTAKRDAMDDAGYKSKSKHGDTPWHSAQLHGSRSRGAKKAAETRKRRKSQRDEGAEMAADNNNEYLIRNSHIPKDAETYEHSSNTFVPGVQGERERRRGYFGDRGFILSDEDEENVRSTNSVKAGRWMSNAYQMDDYPPDGDVFGDGYDDYMPPVPEEDEGDDTAVIASAKNVLKRMKMHVGDTNDPYELIKNLVIAAETKLMNDDDYEPEEGDKPKRPADYNPDDFEEEQQQGTVMSLRAMSLSQKVRAFEVREMKRAQEHAIREIRDHQLKGRCDTQTAAHLINQVGRVQMSLSTSGEALLPRELEMALSIIRRTPVGTHLSIEDRAVLVDRDSDRVPTGRNMSLEPVPNGNRGLPKDTRVAALKSLGFKVNA